MMEASNSDASNRVARYFEDQTKSDSSSKDSENKKLAVLSRRNLHQSAEAGEEIKIGPATDPSSHEFSQETPESIAKKIAYADIATGSSLANGLFTMLSSLSENYFGKDSRAQGALATIGEGFGIVRQLFQYIIHGQQSDETQKADDIYLDYDHNMAAFWLGKYAFAYNTLFAPGLFALKKGLGLLNNQGIFASPARRIINAFSTSSEIMTSLYWNVRRITMGLIPANQKGIKSKDVLAQFNKIRSFFASAGLSILGGVGSIFPFNRIFEHLPQLGLDRESIAKNKAAVEKDSDALELTENALHNYFKNIESFVTGYYISPGTKTKKKLGSQDPENKPHWYHRLQLLSHILGLPLGMIASVFNMVSVAQGFFGELLDVQWLRNKSNKNTSLAYAFQSTLYATGEIAVHAGYLDKLRKEHNIKGIRDLISAYSEGKLQKLDLARAVDLASGVAFTGMGLFRPFGHPSKKFVELTRSFIRLFFSLNRSILHRNEWKRTAGDFSRPDRKVAQDRYKSLYKKLRIVSKALTWNSDVIPTSGARPPEERSRSQKERSEENLKAYIRDELFKEGIEIVPSF